jgi:CHRD domain
MGKHRAMSIKESNLRENSYRQIDIHLNSKYNYVWGIRIILLTHLYYLVGECLGTYSFIFEACLGMVSRDQQQCSVKGDASKHSKYRRIVKLALLGVMGVMLISGFTVASPSVFAHEGSTKAHAELRHTPHGSALLHWEARSDKLRVTIRLVGLTGNSAHFAHIHLGDCDDNGPILYPLTDVVANAPGDATMTTLIPEVEGWIPASGWYINVHRDPGLGATDQFDPGACGNVANPNASSTQDQSLCVFLGGTTVPNQSAFGPAQLTISGVICLSRSMSIIWFPDPSIRPIFMQGVVRASCQETSSIRSRMWLLMRMGTRNRKQ